MKGSRDGFKFWPAVADFMLTLFVMALAVGVLNLLLATLQSVGGLGAGKSCENLEKEKKELEDNNKTLVNQIKGLEEALAKAGKQRPILDPGTSKPVTQKLYEDVLKKLAESEKARVDLEKRVEQLISNNDQLRMRISDLEQKLAKPPLGDTLEVPISLVRPEDLLGLRTNPFDYMVLSKEGMEKLGKGPGAKILSGENNFKPRDPKLTPEFRELLLKRTFPEIELDLRGSFKGNALLVVGHTDKNWITGGRQSTFMPDVALSRAIKDPSTELEESSLGSNADLGLMRALAVKRELDRFLKKRGLGQIEVRCMSASFTVEPEHRDGRTVTDADRRRIEILFVNTKQGSRSIQ